MQIVPAARARDWMERTTMGNAKRCLPLHIANQSGWWILNNETIEIQYFGGAHQSLCEVRNAETGERAYAASSHFGHGIVTFSVPYLFRTPPGWNLHVKGPSNYIIEGAQPLEGIVETDWTPMTFTMNWKITQEMEPIIIQAGEPICQIAPVRRGELEEFECEWGDPADKDVADHDEWCQRRQEFLERLTLGDPEATQRGWQKEYFQGRATDFSLPFPDHQTKLHLQVFPPEALQELPDKP